jgi:uncharacterized FlaG/YvyC family protein
MAINIAPGQTALSSRPESNQQSRNTISLSREAAGTAASENITQSGQSFADTAISTSGSERSEASTTSISAQGRGERQASSILSEASVSLTRREQAVDSLATAIDNLQNIAEDLENEVDPTRQEELRQSAADIISTAQADFDSLQAEDGTIGQAISVSAVLTPGANSATQSQSFATTLSAAPSPSSAGLSTVDFSDPSAAASQLDDIESQVRVAKASFTSSRSEISDAVRSRGSSTASEEKVTERLEFAQAEQLANQIAQSSESLGEVNNLIEISIESLLAEDAVESRDEQREDEVEDIPEQEERRSSDTSPSSLIQKVNGL